ncbi:glycosyltransferase N-terminal domain-containing protein, partial [Acidithiobacillus sp.]|uniref:glycosyltransferase N-terminal domain-containing protein n=1 Tax=Acidithiobacillus sp. TaxID=1872118 RepID=UPI003D057B11
MMSRRLYAFLLWLLSPVVLGFTLWRAWRRPAYRERWWERFGWGPRRSDRPIWIHAVSVGETIAAIPLVRALQARYPEVPILMTSTTPTGAAVVSQRLGTEVLQHYLPYDLSAAVTRFLR